MNNLKEYYKNYDILNENMVKIWLWDLILIGWFLWNIFSISVLNNENEIISTSECYSKDQFVESVENLLEFYLKYPYKKEEQLSFIYMDNIDWVLIWHKDIRKEKCPTDWHIDEIYPWYKTIRGPWGWINWILDFIETEYYHFNDWERDYLKNELKNSIKEKRDIIISWWINNEDINNKQKLLVKDFDRNEAIKNLNWQKFWLEKRNEIQKFGIIKLYCLILFILITIK